MASIAELKKKQAGIAAKMLEIATKDADLTDDDKNAMESLKDEHAKLCDRVSAIEDALEMAPTAPVEADMDDTETDSKSFTNKRSNVLIKRRFVPQKKGASYANVVMAQYVAKSNGSTLSGRRFLEEKLNDMEMAKQFETIMKTASPLGTSLDSTGGALYAPDYVAEMIDLLYAKDVMIRSGADVRPMPQGNMQIPRLATSSTASWVAENAVIGASNPTFDQIDLSFKTIASVVPIGKSLIYTSPLNVQSIISNNMVRDIALKRDAAFLFNSSAGIPLGITNQIASGNVLTQVALPGSGSVLQAVLTNLNALVAQLTVNNVDVDGACFYLHPATVGFLRGITDQVGRAYFVEELARGKLLGFNYFESTQIPANLGGSSNQTYVVFSQPRHTIIGETIPLQIDISDEASYSLNGTLTSAFSNFQTAIRAVSTCDIAVEHNFATSYMLVTGWTNGFTGAAVEYSTQSLNLANSTVQSENPTG